MADQETNGLDMNAAADILFGDTTPSTEEESAKEPTAEHIPEHQKATTPAEIQEHNDTVNAENAEQWEAESRSTFSDTDLGTAVSFVRDNFTPEMQEILNGPIGNNPVVIAQVLALAKKFGG